MTKAWLVLLLPSLSLAAVWPEAIAEWKRAKVAPTAVADRPLWDEYGLKEAETATYEKGAQQFTATGYRLTDSTATLGAFQWKRPAGAVPSKLAPLSAQTPTALVAAHGNFLFAFERFQPSAAEFAALLAGLRNLDTTSLPALTGFLPAARRVDGSERYVLGPVGLEQFSPGIPPSVAAFSMGAEAQVGLFRSPKGDMRLALFNYPTPQIAMQRVEEFHKVPGVMAKRSGPIVAAIVAPPDRDEAEKLLAEVRYEAQITLSERMPTRKDNIADLVLNAFVLIGILLGLTIAGGLVFGGVRALRRVFSQGKEPEAMITLHLENR
jgi:hypothetical protein